MNLIAKKYTVLVENEPVELWIKNNQIKRAKFMQEQTKIKLDLETIKKIQEFPSRILRAESLKSKNFDNAMSKMLSQRLDLAIAKNDKKILSKFAKSNLIPEKSKDRFIEALNQPQGFRAILLKAVNKTNALIQKLSYKIDLFADRAKDRIANQKIDKHLEAYQLREYNKAPPKTDLDYSKSIDPKLMHHAREFIKEHDMGKIKDELLQEKALQNQFFQMTSRMGYNLSDAKLAIVTAGQESLREDLLVSTEKSQKEFENLFQVMKDKLEKYELKEVAENETIEDFKTLSKSIEPVDMIDLLVKNREYQNMPDIQKREIEDKLIFKQEPLKERKEELSEIRAALNEDKLSVQFKKELEQRADLLSNKNTDLTNSKGEIDLDKLDRYVEKLQSVIDTLEKQKQIQSNSRDIREDLKIANNVEHSRGVQNVR